MSNVLYADKKDRLNCKEGDTVTIMGVGFTFSSYGKENGKPVCFKVMESQAVYPLYMLNTLHEVLIPINKDAVRSYEGFILAYMDEEGLYHAVEGQSVAERAIHAQKVLEEHDRMKYYILLRDDIAWINKEGKHVDFRGKEY